MDSDDAYAVFVPKNAHRDRLSMPAWRNCARNMGFTQQQLALARSVSTYSS